MSMHGEPHDDLDRVIDRTASALTSGAPPAGLVFIVRARLNARRPGWTRATVWGVGVSAGVAAVLLAAVTLRQPTPAPEDAADAGRRAALSPGAAARPGPAPSTSSTTRRAAAGPAPRAGATPPADGTPVPDANAAAAVASVASNAPDAAAALIPVEPEPLVFEPLEERQLMVDALQDPMPLEVEQLTVEPITLTEGDV